MSKFMGDEYKCYDVLGETGYPVEQNQNGIYDIGIYSLFYKSCSCHVRLWEP